jgi:hypothetical protein
MPQGYRIAPRHPDNNNNHIVATTATTIASKNKIMPQGLLG